MVSRAALEPPVLAANGRRVGAHPSCAEFAHMAFGMPETGASWQATFDEVQKTKRS
jgi:hypothetical protein